MVLFRSPDPSCFTVGSDHKKEKEYLVNIQKGKKSVVVTVLTYL